MAGPDPLRRFRDEAVAALAPSLDPNAPGLVQVLRRSIEYADVQRPRSQVVVDRRALLLALVAIGLETTPVYANTSTWIADWLRDRLQPLDLELLCAHARTPLKALADAVDHDFRLVTSESVRAAVLQAVGFAKATVGRDKIALRHLFFALLVQPNHIFEIKEFNWTATESDLAELRALLFERIGSDPESRESMEAWQTLLGKGETAAPADEPGPAPAPRPAAPTAEFVSGFDADRTFDESDPLETDADVLALARLICHEDADPPISIGVFGGWGSGKSTFMEALQRHVAALATPLADTALPADGPRFVSPIVQIRFNAWQFADANLWASLTAEFFDQLRAGGFEGGGKRIHARLIEDVNEHVRGLSKDAGARRAAVAMADDKLREAQSRHDRAVRDKDSAVRQALVTGLAEAYDRNRGELERYGLVDPRSADKLGQFIAVARDSRSQAGQLKHIAKILVAQWPLLIAVITVSGLVVAAAAAVAPDQPVAVTLAGLVTAAAGLLPLARRGLAVMQAIVRQVGPFADRIGEADEHGLRQVLETEMALRLAAEEANALRAVSERADRALARYVDPAARANPPRVLRYLLEDDPDTKAFEKEIGLIGRARRLFQALDEIVADNRIKLDKARSEPTHATGAAETGDAETEAPDPDIPARIILYIDDLDRCTHDQVYKVLQAVHLLLAFELFVVVVAVDVAWVEAAVAKSIEFAVADTDEDDAKEADRRRRAIEYLSKIFQLPFWLKPFSGRDDGRYSKYIRSLTRAAPRERPVEDEERQPVQDGVEPDAPPSRRPIAAPGGDSQPGPEEPGEGPGGGEADVAGNGQRHDPAAVARALKTLQLSADEEDFLASADISAVAASDPRGVKRLVNVYKIVRARLSETGEVTIVGDGNGPPAYPLIALCAAIETGQPLEVADAFYQALKEKAELEPDAEVDTQEPIRSAMAAAVEARGGISATSQEVLDVARVVRRYSFNRYH